MKKPPDEATIATATELSDLLRIAVDATRAAIWHPGDSLESLLAPAVVAIAAECGKAVGPHADLVREQTVAGFANFTIMWDCGYARLWCQRCPPTPIPVKVFRAGLAEMPQVLEAMTVHNDKHHGDRKTETDKENET